MKSSEDFSEAAGQHRIGNDNSTPEASDNLESKLNGGESESKSETPFFGQSLGSNNIKQPDSDTYETLPSDELEPLDPDTAGSGRLIKSSDSGSIEPLYEPTQTPESDEHETPESLELKTIDPDTAGSGRLIKSSDSGSIEPLYEPTQTPESDEHERLASDTYETLPSDNLKPIDPDTTGSGRLIKASDSGSIEPLYEPTNRAGSDRIRRPDPRSERTSTGRIRKQSGRQPRPSDTGRIKPPSGPKKRPPEATGSGTGRIKPPSGPRKRPGSDRSRRPDAQSDGAGSIRQQSGRQPRPSDTGSIKPPSGPRKRPSEATDSGTGRIKPLYRPSPSDRLPRPRRGTGRATRLRQRDLESGDYRQAGTHQPPTPTEGQRRPSGRRRRQTGKGKRPTGKVRQKAPPLQRRKRPPRPKLDGLETRLIGTYEGATQSDVEIKTYVISHDAKGNELKTIDIDMNPTREAIPWQAFLNEDTDISDFVIGIPMQIKTSQGVSTKKFNYRLKGWKHDSATGRLRPAEGGGSYFFEAIPEDVKMPVIGIKVAKDIRDADNDLLISSGKLNRKLHGRGIRQAPKIFGIGRLEHPNLGEGRNPVYVAMEKVLPNALHFLKGANEDGRNIIGKKGVHPAIALQIVYDIACYFEALQDHIVTIDGKEVSIPLGFGDGHLEQILTRMSPPKPGQELQQGSERLSWGVFETVLPDSDTVKQLMKRTQPVYFTPFFGDPHYLEDTNKDGGRYKETTDTFSLGAILYTLITGKKLLEHRHITGEGEDLVKSWCYKVMESTLPQRGKPSSPKDLFTSYSIYEAIQEYIPELEKLTVALAKPEESGLFQKVLDYFWGDPVEEEPEAEGLTREQEYAESIIQLLKHCFAHPDYRFTPKEAKQFIENNFPMVDVAKMHFDVDTQKTINKGKRRVPAPYGRWKYAHHFKNGNS